MTTPRDGAAEACPFAHDDAAYVLGALPPAERLAFERHLATCDECSRSVGQLAGIPGLLARVPLDAVESPPEPVPVPPSLLPTLVGEVRRQARRRRWATGLAAAAAVAVVAGGTAAVVSSTRDDAPPVAGPRLATAHEMAQLDQDEVDASVAVTSVAWGTRLDLTCSYDGPTGGYQHDAAPPTYALVVRTAAGTEEQVATWTALPGRTMHVTGATALAADRITAVEVRTAGGHPVLELPVS